MVHCTANPNKPSDLTHANSKLIRNTALLLHRLAASTLRKIMLQPKPNSRDSDNVKLCALPLPFHCPEHIVAVSAQLQPQRIRRAFCGVPEFNQSLGYSFRTSSSKNFRLCRTLDSDSTLVR